MGRGLFLAFEGIDASGKSTQARRVAELHDAHFAFEPGDTPLGVDLRYAHQHRRDFARLIAVGVPPLLALLAVVLFFAAGRRYLFVMMYVSKTCHVHKHGPVHGRSRRCQNPDDIERLLMNDPAFARSMHRLKLLANLQLRPIRRDRTNHRVKVILFREVLPLGELI